MKKIARLLDISHEEVKKSVAELREEYREKRGLRILEKDDKAQIVTAPENAAFVAQFIKSEFAQGLSRPALETLSIVAYRGPISHAAIEELRGVNSSFTLRSILLRGLVERVENPKDKRSYLYRISFDFLKTLGIERVENLPNYEQLNKKVDAYQSVALPDAAAGGTLSGPAEEAYSKAEAEEEKNG